MRGRAWVTLAAGATVVALVGAYAWADATDRVPGVLTDEPIAVSPAPFLSAAPVSPASAVEGLWWSAEAPIPSASQVQAIAQAVRDDARTGSSTNVAVVDLVTGDVLADLGGAETQVPASTTKLLTAVAALTELGPDFVTETAATWTDGQVTLVAGGDMMLAAGEGHGGARAEANGWAGLADLAAQVVESIEPGTAVEVVVDDSDFPGPAVNPEWPDYAPRLGYAAGVSGLAVNIAKVEDELYAQRHPDPSLAAGDDFARALIDAGLEVTDVRRGDSPADAEQVGSVESAPLSLVVEHFMHISDNTIAENVGRVLALETDRPATPAGAAEATIAALEDLGVDVADLRLYDSAGFSTRNRIAPFHLTGALRAALADPHGREMLNYLPVAGVEGTVSERYSDSNTAGVMRAKTGSLTGVTSLAGVVSTSEGRVLAFAILADGMPYGQDRPRAAFDDFLMALTECGCDQ